MFFSLLYHNICDRIRLIFVIHTIYHLHLCRQALYLPFLVPIEQQPRSLSLVIQANFVKD